MSNYGLGSQGAEVNRIQTRLKQLGNYAGQVDGIYTASTETAVKAFQTAHSIGVTGVVGLRRGVLYSPARLCRRLSLTIRLSTVASP